MARGASWLKVTAAVEVKMLVGSGWTSVGVTDRRVIIDINENKMGTVLLHEHFLSRDRVADYVNDDYDTLTVRCRIHVFDHAHLEGFLPQPTRVPPVRRSANAGGGRVRPREAGVKDSTPAKRRRLR